MQARMIGGTCCCVVRIVPLGDFTNSSSSRFVLPYPPVSLRLSPLKFFEKRLSQDPVYAEEETVDYYTSAHQMDFEITRLT